VKYAFLLVALILTEVVGFDYSVEVEIAFVLVLGVVDFAVVEFGAVLVVAPL